MTLNTFSLQIELPNYLPFFPCSQMSYVLIIMKLNYYYVNNIVSPLLMCSRTFSLLKREIKPTDFTYSYYLQAVMSIIKKKKKTVWKFYFIFPCFAGNFIVQLVTNDKMQGDLNQVIIILYQSSQTTFRDGKTQGINFICIHIILIVCLHFQNTGQISSNQLQFML